MYRRYVPFTNPATANNGPFVSQNKFGLVTGTGSVDNPTHDSDTPQSSHQNVDQVGHGEIKPDPSVDSSEKEAKISMQELLDRMKKPVYDVKVVKATTGKGKVRKSEPEEEAAAPKKLKELYEWF